MSPRGLVGVLLTLVIGCDADRRGERAAEADAEAPPAPADAAPIDAGHADAAPDAASFPPGVPGCAIADDDPRRERVETRCDGVDNDCDGLVDVLLPLDDNRCETGLAGACAVGYASCEGGQRVCLGSGPLPEVEDGIDNDCDGTIDGAPPVAVKGRALVAVPSYLWGDDPVFIEGVTSALDQRGVPYDRPGAGVAFSTALDGLAEYALAVIPGYLVGDALSDDDRTKLEAFVEGGGVVVVLKPLGASGTNGLLLTGLASSTQSRDVTSLHFEGAAVPASAFDTREERDLLLSDDPATRSVETYVLEPAAGTTVVARARAGGSAVGAAVTRRPLGLGAIYALGHDLVAFRHARCLVNCFEPAGDLLGMFLRDALREGARGHVVLVHPVPGPEDSLLLLTHDSDAREQDDGGTGAGVPGTLQMARLERERDARATFYLSTSYDGATFDGSVLEELCALGTCPAGIHSVRHGRSFATQAKGTCTETFATYPSSGEPTLCGEIRVSDELVTLATGRKPRSFRSPYLLIHPDQFDVLAASGIESDSSYLVGGLKYNLPLSARTTGVNQDVFRRNPLYELPIAVEDGLLTVEGGVITRRELDASTAPTFVSLWTQVLLLNRANRSYTTALVHPTAHQTGGDPAANALGPKLDAVAALIDAARAAGVRLETVERTTDYWRAREGLDVRAAFGGGSYQGTIRTGARPIAGLTLELGDAIASFTCAACGPVQVAGKRVVIASTLAPNHDFAFTATPR